MHYMTGGQVHRAHGDPHPCGAGRRSAAQHSQSLEAWFVHVPGLKVVTPVHPLRRQGAAQERHPRRQPRHLLRAQDALPAQGAGARGRVPDPPGRGRVKRPGRTSPWWPLQHGDTRPGGRRCLAKEDQPRGGGPPHHQAPGHGDHPGLGAQDPPGPGGGRGPSVLRRLGGDRRGDRREGLRLPGRAGEALRRHGRAGALQPRPGRPDHPQHRWAHRPGARDDGGDR